MRLLSGILKILSFAVYIIIAAMIAIAAPMLFGYHPAAVLSGSMEPVYPMGSIIYYKAAEFDDINIGDAVTFRLGGEILATHRILEKDSENQSFTTKGDNNPSKDINPLPYSKIAGKSTDFNIQYAGYFTNMIKNWRVITVFAGILLLGMFVKPRKQKCI
jgi:signal peptidase